MARDARGCPGLSLQRARGTSNSSTSGCRHHPGSALVRMEEAGLQMVGYGRGWMSRLHSRAREDDSTRARYRWLLDRGGRMDGVLGALPCGLSLSLSLSLAHQAQPIRGAGSQCCPPCCGCSSTAAATNGQVGFLGKAPAWRVWGAIFLGWPGLEGQRMTCSLASLSIPRRTAVDSRPKWPPARWMACLPGCIMAVAQASRIIQVWMFCACPDG